jgi:hypothetical protein
VGTASGTATVLGAGSVVGAVSDAAAPFSWERDATSLVGSGFSRGAVVSPGQRSA